MSKQEKRERLAALKAAKAAAKAENKPAVETTKVAETAKETKKEDKVENPQVNNNKPAEKVENKPSETKLGKTETKVEEKPKVEEKKVETKQEKKVENPKPSPKKEDKKHESKIPAQEAEVVQAEVITEIAGLSPAKTTVTTTSNIGSTKSSFDGKSNLAYVIQKRYGENPKLQQECPELCDAMLQNLDVVVVLSLIDLHGELGGLNLTGDIDKIFKVKEVANLLGINVPEPKALPNKQAELNLKEGDYPAKIMTRKEAGLSEANAPEYIPDLDPKKPRTKEEIIEVLEYQLTKSSASRIAPELLLNAINWYRTFCLEQEENTEKRLEIDNTSITDLLDKIFELVNPTKTIQALGRAQYLYTSQTGSPVMAHAILHKYLAPKNCTEEDIAEILKYMIKANFRLKLKDDPNCKESDDKAIEALIKNLGTEYIDKVMNPENEFYSKVTGSVRIAYLGKDKPYTDDQIRKVIGQIINVYRDPIDRLSQFTDVLESTSKKEDKQVENPTEKVEKKN